ncbi:DGQHR domain-containing protein [Shewanella sp.]|uniref:DGQHR domain-containing protein n=1 Tax=Shewanella sp. TaxID=50422 RepID=UPI004048C5D9
MDKFINENDMFYTSTAIKLEQPLGVFYVFKIPASKLIEVAFSMAAYNQDGKLSGVQRKLKQDRIKQIALYTGATNATFPSPIILSANFDNEGHFVDDENLRWQVIENQLFIPTNQQLASIIDGQHRIEGIKEAAKKDNFSDFDVLCSVYFDLAFAQQAEIFTSINYNQKKVDKSVAYELFGYDLEDTDINNWSPDTLAIYFSRILNKDSKSPLYGHIYSSIDGDKKHEEWFVSTACLVESICLLLTNDATRDRYTIHQSSFFGASGRKRLKEVKSNAPLRELYINRKDKDILNIVVSFLEKINQLGWFKSSDLVTTKTIGFLAMFEVLKEVLQKNNIENVDNVSKLFDFLNDVKVDDLHKDSFSFSGIGKSQVKKILKGEGV